MNLKGFFRIRLTNKSAVNKAISFCILHFVLSNFLNELSKKCAGLEPTELESKYLFKSIDDFDSAFAKLQSNRMYN